MYFEIEKKGEGWLYEKGRKTGIHLCQRRLLGKMKKQPIGVQTQPHTLQLDALMVLGVSKLKSTWESPGEHLSLSG